MDMFLMLFWLALAAVCFLYGKFIHRGTPGTLFFASWYAIGAVFLLFGGAVPLHLWSRLPASLQIIFLTAAGLVITAVLIILGCIWSQYHAAAEPGLDYIIVLGAQMRPTGPSRVLLSRLFRTIDYLEASPGTICIVSGGQGPDEPCTEAEGMAAYLTQHGIPSERILLEKESTDTVQNIAYSRRLMKNPEQATVGIVTNNFHVFRALQTARKHGLPQAVGLAGECTRRYVPNNILREILAEIKFLIRNL